MGGVAEKTNAAGSWDESARERFLETLRRGAEQLGLILPPEALPAFLHHAERLLEANQRTNLTRITGPAPVAVKHFLDSLTVLVACPDLADGARVADVGTGAGFPGLPLNVVRPDFRLTLLDSLAKRLTFLEAVVRDLGLSGVSLAHARAEDAGRDPAHRDHYDLVTARAVAALPILLEWCGPLVRPPAGRFVALKSGNVDDELAASRTAANALNLRLVRDLPLTLPAADPDEPEPLHRRLLVWQKLRPTPPRFPRRPADIKARPL